MSDPRSSHIKPALNTPGGFPAGNAGAWLRTTPYPGRRVQEAAPCLQAVCGYSLSSFAGSEALCFDELLCDEAEDARTQFAGLGRGEETYCIEYPIRHAAGRIRWLREQGRCFYGEDGVLSCLDSVVIDITPQKETAAGLIESERRFLNLVGNLPGMAYRCANDPNWTMEFVSSGCRELTGYEPQEVVGNRVISYGAIIIPEDREAVWNAVQAGVESGERYRTVYRIRTKQGAVRWVWEQGLGVTALNGELTALEGFITDISEQREAEDRRRQLEIQIEQARKLESLGLLAGGIAHDFNNILMAVLGHLEIALSDLSPSAPTRKNLQSAESAGRKGADLCRQLLAYSGKGKFFNKRVDLNRVIEEFSPVLKASISKKAMLRFDLASSLPPIEADVAQLHQVLMNLASNASEALSGEQGIISLATSAVHCTSSFLANLQSEEPLAEGTYVQLQIADTGCGMEDETLNRIFDPFFSTKFAGRGLGLPAVQGIIRGHRGALGVTTEKNRGTSFRVLFPAAALKEAQPAPAPVEEQWKGAGLVLLVDDEEAVRWVGGEMLARLGFRSLAAAGGSEAVKLFRRYQHEIFCVILDLTMPGMNGRETLAELRLLDPKVPVIMASGYSEQEIHESADKISGFLQKPYELNALAARLRKITKPAQ